MLHWPLWGEITGDRWIPLTEGQSHGKCFHLMTSSCVMVCCPFGTNTLPGPIFSLLDSKVQLSVFTHIFDDPVRRGLHAGGDWGLFLCVGNLPVTGHKGQWRGAFMFSLIYASINGWVYNREAGDLRGHCAHYDVTVMSKVVATFKHVDGSFHIFMATTGGDVWIITSLRIWVMCCMLSTFDVSSRIVANISESSLLLSQ